MFPQRHRAISVSASPSTLASAAEGTPIWKLPQLHAGIGVWLSVHFTKDL